MAANQTNPTLPGSTAAGFFFVWPGVPQSRYGFQPGTPWNLLSKSTAYTVDVLRPIAQRLNQMPPPEDHPSCSTGSRQRRSARDIATTQASHPVTHTQARAGFRRCVASGLHAFGNRFCHRFAGRRVGKRLLTSRFVRYGAPRTFLLGVPKRSRALRRFARINRLVFDF